MRTQNAYTILCVLLLCLVMIVHCVCQMYEEVCIFVVMVVFFNVFSGVIRVDEFHCVHWVCTNVPGIS